MISTSNIKSWLIGILIPAMILSHANNPLISINHIYVIYALIICISLIETTQLNINEVNKIVYLCVLLSTAIVPVIVFHIESLSSFIYVGLLILFIFVMDISGKTLRENTHKIINMWVYIGIFVVGFLVVRNFGEINSETITGVLYAGDIQLIRYRAKFGFHHSNFAAIGITTLLFCIYLKFKYACSRNERRFSVLLVILLFIPLLCTGSRTALISFGIFVISEIIFKIVGVIENKRVQFLLGVIGIGFLIIASINIVNTNSMSAEEFSTLTSGRYGTILENIKILEKEGKLWFGNTVTQVSSANKALSAIGASTSDNWYYLQIARFGVVGLVLMIFAIIAIFSRLIRGWRYFGTDSVAVSSLLSLLVYGFGENVVYNQGVSICAVVWIFILKEVWNVTSAERGSMYGGSDSCNIDQK